MRIEIVAEPIGGLCNRMIYIASVNQLAKKLDAKLKVIWNINHELGCPADDIFLPLESIELTNRPNYLYRLHRSVQNINPAIYKKWLGLSYDLVLLQSDFMQNLELLENNNTSKKLLGCHRSYLQFYNNIFKQGEYDWSIFKLSPQIEKEISTILTQIGQNTYGLHIRRTDSLVSIEKSPLSSFIIKIEKHLVQDPATTFYLATDDIATEKELIKRFNNKIFIYSNNKERNSAEGIKQAVIDLYVLSKTQKVYGSHGSTFSYMASQLGGIETEFV